MIPLKITATRNSSQLKGKPSYASTQPLKVLAFFQYSKLFFSMKGMYKWMVCVGQRIKELFSIQ
ncbi:hypothetical protein J2780_001301 [Chryseobacterium camelliae]|nr:hypothetical protein [Chryseobacterium camelliae]